MSNTVKLKNYSDVMIEKAAAAGITPGMLVQLTSANTVQAHAQASGNALPMFACEDELQGKGIDDAYIATDKVQVWIPGRGDEVQGILNDGETVVIGDFLSSAGNGKVKKHVAIIDSAADVETIYVNSIVGQATIAVDMSGSAGVDPDGRISFIVL